MYDRTDTARVIRCDATGCPAEWIQPYLDPATAQPRPGSAGEVYRAARDAGWLWSAVDLCPEHSRSVELDLTVGKHVRAARAAR